MVFGRNPGGLVGAVELRGGHEEEEVVELHDAAQAPVVGIFGARSPGHSQRHGGELRRHHGRDERGVGVAEAVDALLGVADYEVVECVGRRLRNEGAQVFPLQGRGVLKFVDEVMVEPRSEPLVDEGGLVVADDAAEQGAGVGELDEVVALQKLLDVLADAVHECRIGKRRLVEQPEHGLGGLKRALPRFHGLVEAKGGVGQHLGVGRRETHLLPFGGEHTCRRGRNLVYRPLIFESRELERRRGRSHLVGV